MKHNLSILHQTHFSKLKMTQIASRKSLFFCVGLMDPDHDWHSFFKNPKKKCFNFQISTF